MAKNYALTWDPAAIVFPLSVAASGRYLQTAGGSPFRLQSEFAWPMATLATLTNVNTYLADRKAKGFNAFEMMAVVADTTGVSPPFARPRVNQNGDEPFTTVGDLSTPKAAYWSFVDSIVDAAAAQGFAVLLYPLYTGYQGGADGWWSVVAANSTGNCQGYGTFIGNRYKSKPNVILMFGGDFTQPNDATRAKYVAFADAVRATGATNLAGAEWGDPDTLVTDQGGYTYGTNPATSHMQLDSFYGQGAAGNGRTYATADRSWVRSSPVLPGFACETMQGDGTYTPIASGRSDIRRYLNWAATAGANAGVNMGQVNLANEWALSHLSDNFFLDAAKHHALFQSLKWHLMAPSGTASVSPHGSAGSSAYCGRVLIVSGGGSGDSLITSCLSSDGTQLLAYVPSTGTGTTTFSVDFRSMAGTCTAYWWDPLTGVLSTIGNFANSLSAQSFTTPSASGRADSSNDWMLVCKVPS